MPEIEERIAEFLDEKLAPVSATHSGPAGLLSRLSGAAVALASFVERTAARLKSILASRPAAIASPARSALRQELADHLRDAYDHQLELGLDPDAAWAHVTSHFGDYDAILGELESLHQPTPLWEIVTRILAFVAGLSALHTTGVSVKDVLLPTIAMALLLSAPLAAFNPLVWGLPGWLHWAARALALFFFVFPAREEGLAYGDVFSVAIVIMIASLLGRPFASSSYATRLRSWMLAIAFGFTAMGLQAVWIYAHSPSMIGSGVAVIFVGVLYGVLLARPRLWALLLLAAACHGTVVLLALFVGWPVAFNIGISHSFFLLPMICILFGLLAAWVFYGRCGYACWFQAAGLVAMILTYIAYLKNLTVEPSIPTIMLSTSLPLLLWLVPVMEMVYRKFRGEE